MRPTTPRPDVEMPLPQREHAVGTFAEGGESVDGPLQELRAGRALNFRMGRAEGLYGGFKPVLERRDQAAVRRERRFAQGGFRRSRRDGDVAIGLIQRRQRRRMPFVLRRRRDVVEAAPAGAQEEAQIVMQRGEPPAHAPALVRGLESELLQFAGERDPLARQLVQLVESGGHRPAEVLNGDEIAAVRFGALRLGENQVVYAMKEALLMRQLPLNSAVLFLHPLDEQRLAHVELLQVAAGERALVLGLHGGEFGRLRRDARAHIGDLVGEAKPRHVAAVDLGLLRADFVEQRPGDRRGKGEQADAAEQRQRHPDPQAEAAHAVAPAHCRPPATGRKPPAPSSSVRKTASEPCPSFGPKASSKPPRSMSVAFWTASRKPLRVGTGPKSSRM